MSYYSLQGVVRNRDGVATQIQVCEILIKVWQTIEHGLGQVLQESKI